MRPNAFAAIALAAVIALAASCGKDPDRDVAKDLSRAAPPPQPTTSAPQSTTGTNTNSPANLGQPSNAERQEGSNPQQGQVDPKESSQRKDFQQDTKPNG